jgi:hypothetical protein
MKTPSLMTEQRKHGLQAIDAAIKLERAAIDKLEAMKATCIPRPAPQAIAINGAPASGISINDVWTTEKTPRGTVSP